MKLEVRSTIKLPKNIPKLTKVIQAYTYETKGETFFSTIKVEGGEFYVPRNITKLRRFIPEVVLIDKRNYPRANTSIELDKTKLMSHQQVALDNYIQLLKEGNTDILIDAPTGAGKSYMLSFFLNELQTKTLILADRVNLVEQLKEEIENITGIVPKGLKDFDPNVDDFLVTTVQSLNNKKKLNRIKDWFGCVVLDEAHIAGAKQITNILQTVNSKYRIGLSATPTRSDGLTEVLFDLFEHKLTVKYKTDINIKAYQIIVNDIEDGKYRSIIDSLRRNYEEVMFQLLFYLLKKGHQVFIAVDTNILQQEYSDYINDMGYPCGVINAQTSKEERRKLLTQFQNNELKVILGYKVLEKGANIGEMTALIDFFSTSTKENVEQLLGRLNRKGGKFKEKLFFTFSAPMSLYNQHKVKENTLTALKEKLNLSVFKLDVLRLLMIIR